MHIVLLLGVEDWGRIVDRPEFKTDLRRDSDSLDSHAPTLRPTRRPTTGVVVCTSTRVLPSNRPNVFRLKV